MATSPSANTDKKSSIFIINDEKLSSSFDANIDDYQKFKREATLVQKAIRNAREQRCKALKQLRKQAATTIRKLSTEIDKVMSTFADIKAVLITAVLRKTSQLERQLLQHSDSQLEQHINILIRHLLIDTQHAVHEKYFLDTLPDCTIQTTEQLKYYENLKQLRNKFANKQLLTVEHSQSCLTLIAPQLLQLVAELDKPIKATHDKLRTLTLTTQVIVSIGGDATYPTNQAAAYDPVSQKWTQACDMHRTRVFTAATTRNGKVVVAGGTTDQSRYDETVEEYDPVSNSWNWLSNLLVGRNYHALVTVNDRIYALGGRKEEEVTKIVDKKVTTSVKCKTTNSVETLESEATNWTNAQQMLIARYAFVAVSVQVSQTA